MNPPVTMKVGEKIITSQRVEEREKYEWRERDAQGDPRGTEGA